jgi:hypothetical protein
MKRTLSPAALDFFDTLVRPGELAKMCIEKKLSRQLFVQAAKACLGIREIPPNKGREVKLFQSTVEAHAGDAWCMAFVQSCLAYAEETTGMQSALAASASVMSVWNSTAADWRVKSLPLAGAIAIWQHTRDPGHGHTGIVLDCDGVSFHAIEGNTRDGYTDLQAKVGQAGEGVGFTHRRFDLFNPQRGDMQLRGFLKPY